MNKKLALDLGIQTNQILTNDDEFCIPRLSTILIDVILCRFTDYFAKNGTGNVKKRSYT